MIGFTQCDKFLSKSFQCGCKELMKLATKEVLIGNDISRDLNVDLDGSCKKKKRIPLSMA